MKRWFGHLKTVLLHKYWVFRYALTAGIPFRGLLHDLSKFSPAEFGQSVRYYTGSRSPIHYVREANSFSTAWLHHRGRNRHHFEYWVDNTARGGLITVPMPFPCALELICDRLGAAVQDGNGKFHTLWAPPAPIGRKTFQSASSSSGSTLRSPLRR